MGARLLEQSLEMQDIAGTHDELWYAMWVVFRTGKSQLSGDLRPWGALSFVTWPLLTELSKGDGPVMCSSVFLVSVVLRTGESYFLRYALLTLHRAPLLLLIDPLTAWGSAQTLVAIGILCFSLKADFISWSPFPFGYLCFLFFYRISEF